MHASYPFCDVRFREWVYREVPPHEMIDPATKTNKVLVRKHIGTRFPDLPYVKKKGSFRFDVRGWPRSGSTPCTISRSRPGTCCLGRRHGLNGIALAWETSTTRPSSIS
jgi:hypothetical protein